MKSRPVAIIVCFLLGGLGIHKFYLGKIGWGVAYLLFFWTAIPAIVAFVEFLILVFMSDAEFDRQYNSK